MSVALPVVALLQFIGTTAPCQRRRGTS
jgi:hypothetical protein